MLKYHAKVTIQSISAKDKSTLSVLRRCLIRWEQRESNPRPSACKADALNQLSYAPVMGMQRYALFLKVQILFDFFIEKIFFHYICIMIQWGCFGFDSIRHWSVSTSGVGGLPVNLSLRTISWQQLLCTRCVVCKAHYLNPRRQGCVADEYPSRL